jgi:DNA polymerase III delta subunit
MITLLHGEYIEASRAELNRLIERAKGREIRRVEGKSVDASLLVQSLESSSLFTTDTLVVVEQLFGKLGRQTKKIAQYAEIITRAADQMDIILWEDSQLTVAMIKHLGASVAVREFTLPVLIFQFLDSVRAGNRKQTLSIFSDLIRTHAPELVFSMLVKRVRQLMLLVTGGQPAGLAAWQLTRLTTQAKSFTIDELIVLYGKLADAEYSIKSGSSAFTFRQRIEQVLVTL